MENTPSLSIGTCSWKYDSWKGLVYPEARSYNPLEEYSHRYSSVEVDQWFWSLFEGDKVKLPDPKVVKEYSEAVPENFTFGIKVPNSITLTHHYTHKKQLLLKPNPHFLSLELMKRFLETLNPLSNHNLLLMFQFEYLNKKKMAGVNQFIEQFGVFCNALPAGYDYCVEIRNPNYLTRQYFEFLKEQNLHHVFLHGYYMPPVYQLFSQIKQYLTNTSVVRLHGSDRKAMEEKTKKKWDKRIAPKENDLAQLIDMLAELKRREIHSFVFVNNHFEGSAPRTIARIEQLLGIEH